MLLDHYTINNKNTIPWCLRDNFLIRFTFKSNLLLKYKKVLKLLVQLHYSSWVKFFIHHNHHSHCLLIHSQNQHHILNLDPLECSCQYCSLRKDFVISEITGNSVCKFNCLLTIFLFFGSVAFDGVAIVGPRLKRFSGFW